LGKSGTANAQKENSEQNEPVNCFHGLNVTFIVDPFLEPIDGPPTLATNFVYGKRAFIFLALGSSPSAHKESIYAQRQNTQ